MFRRPGQRGRRTADPAEPREARAGTGLSDEPSNRPGGLRPRGEVDPVARNTTAKGRLAEDLALSYLQRRGLKLISRNYRCRAGEVDLVVEQAGTLVFVEVRSRASAAFVNPKETVDWRKQQRLARVAACFLRARRNLAGRPVRFDVVSVTRPNYNARLEWIRNAFQVDDAF